MSKKSRTTLRFITLTVGVALLAGCTPAAEPEASEPETVAAGGAITVVDMAGREVTLDEHPETLVNTGLAAGRISTYLGLADAIVGVESNEPEATISRPYSYVHLDHFQSVPVIGQGGPGGSVPNVEALLEVNPDVVIADWPAEKADEISATTGIPVVVVTYAQIFDGQLAEALRIVGEVFDVSDRAEELITAMDAAQADLQERTAAIPEAERPTAYTGGVNSRGKQGFVGSYGMYEAFDLVNVINVVDETGTAGGVVVDLEQVLAWDPEYIFLNPENLGMMREDYLARPDVYDSLTAIQNGRVFSHIPFGNSKTNIELALADAYYTGTVVYPEQFADVDPVEKLNEFTELFLGVALYDDFAARGMTFGELTLN